MGTISDKRVTFHRIMWRLGVAASKPDILAGYGVKSTTELSEPQLDELIGRMKKSLDNKIPATPEVRTWRSNVLLQCNRCGKYAHNGDWTEINRFLLDDRIAGKLLYELNIKEMKQLCRKLRVIADKKAAQDKKNMFKGINPN